MFACLINFLENDFSILFFFVASYDEKKRERKKNIFFTFNQYQILGDKETKIKRVEFDRSLTKTKKLTSHFDS